MKNAVRLVLILLLGAVSSQAGFGQTPATRRVMREKLGHSQKILEAILTSNFTLLETESTALTKATRSPAWTVLQGPEYLRQSEAFLKSLRELGAAARDRDLDTAVSRYTALTTSCFACHRYMKDRRLAGPS
jgi:cytochrome c556